MNTGKKDKPAAPAEKDKKHKLVRDSFTLPKGEYAAIDAIKQRALNMAMAVKKSEVVRAALMSLATMNDVQLKAALSAVPTLKTGRPSKDKPATAPAEPAAKPAAKPAVKAAAKPATRTAARKAAPAPAPSKTAPAKRAPAAKKAAVAT
jgi:hypothetical protein